MHKNPRSSEARQSVGAAAAPALAQEKVEGDKRPDRIIELRDQYRAGTYRVDAEELSRKIIDSHLEK
jgi:anti-sigma28 factor (negative regulator of flagellin synthesis)